MADPFHGLFRLKRLSKEDRDQLTGFVELVNQLPLEGVDEFSLKDLEEGNIPENVREALSNFDFGDPELKVLARTQSVLDKATPGGGKSEILTDFLFPKDPDDTSRFKIFDEADLTDEELEERKTAFEQLGETGAKVGRGEVEQALRSALPAVGVQNDEASPNKVEGFTQKIADLIEELQRFPTPAEFRDRISPTTSTPLANFFDDQDTRNRFTALIEGFTKPQNRIDDVRRIQDILTARGEERAEETDIDALTASIPGSLTSEREKFLSTLERTGLEELGESRGDILSAANVRGGLFSGAPTDLLTSSTTRFASEIANIEARLLQEDTDFFFNITFDNALRKSLKASDDLQASIAAEREGISTAQETRFRSGQADLRRFLDLESANRSVNRQLTSQAERLRRRSSEDATRRRLGLTQNIATAVGTVGGAVAGGPPGAVIGGTFGRSIS